MMALTGLGSKGPAKGKNGEYTVVAALPGGKSKTLTVTAKSRDEAIESAFGTLGEQGLLNDVMGIFVRMPSPPGLE